MPKIILICGLPGSGKSTAALKYVGQGFAWYEADMFFVKDNVYSWVPSLVPTAHQWCQKNTEKAMQEGKNIVVSNTNVTKKDRQHYVDLAAFYGYELEIEDLHDAGLTDEELASRNIHRVPVQGITNMRRKYVRHK